MTPKRFIDLSISIEPELPSDPPMMIPKIDYINHQSGAEQMKAFYPGVRKEQLPGGLGWAVEFDSFRHPPGCSLSLSSHHGQRTEGLNH
jgi:hypothetical protein